MKNRKIKSVGIDTASLDYGQSVNFETHQILFEKNIPGLENVANLDRLPAKGATVYAAPMFIKDGSGGPCRIFARLGKDQDHDPKSAAMMLGRSGFLGIIVSFGFLLSF